MELPFCLLRVLIKCSLLNLAMMLTSRSWFRQAEQYWDRESSRYVYALTTVIPVRRSIIKYPSTCVSTETFSYEGHSLIRSPRGIIGHLSQESADEVGVWIESLPLNVSSKIEYGRSLFHTAAGHDKSKVVAQLLQRPDIDVNCQTTYGETPLHHAALYNNLETIGVLLQHPNIDVNIKCNDNCTPLDKAIKNQKNPYSPDELMTVGKLLQRPDIDINTKIKDGRTVLHSAIMRGKVGSISMLLKHPDIDVNHKDIYGNTPLHYAAERQSYLYNTFRDTEYITRVRVMVMEELLQHSDIILNLKNNKGETPLDIAEKTRYPRELIDILERHMSREIIDDFECYMSRKS